MGVARSLHARLGLECSMSSFAPASKRQKLQEFNPSKEFFPGELGILYLLFFKLTGAYHLIFLY